MCVVGGGGVGLVNRGGGWEGVVRVRMRLGSVGMGDGG